MTADLDEPSYGAFTHTSLEPELRRRGIVHLYFAGVTTDVCVHTTVQEAAAVRTLRAEFSSEHGTVERVAHQLGYGVESVRSCVPGRSINRVSRCCK